MADVIQRLRELRQSSEGSVIRGIEDAPSTVPPHVPHALDVWLERLAQLSAGSSPGPSTPRLLVIAGNAGDGKSALLRSIRSRLRAEGVPDDSVKWLLDATHSDSLGEPSQVRLGRFFAPFEDAQSWAPPQLHVCAVNTGALVGFFESQRDTGRFSSLEAVLSLQLGLRARAQGTTVPPTQQLLFDRAFVVDLDRRNLVSLSGDGAFFRSMLDTLSPSTGTLLSDTSTRCDRCPLAQSCPVHVNVLALLNARVRDRLLFLLRDIALEGTVHLGPRSLWHLIYEMTVGGLDRSRVERGAPLTTCSDMGGLDAHTKATTLFFDALYHRSPPAPGESETAVEDGGGQALLAEIRRLDPARRFSLQALEDAVRATLSEAQDRDLAAPAAALLGVEPDALLCHPKRRAAGAQRRSFFMRDAHPDEIRQRHMSEWTDHLYKRRQSELGSGDPPVLSLATDVLRKVFQQAVVPGGQQVFNITLPWKAQRSLFTQVDLRSGKASEPDARVRSPDTYRAQLRDETIALANALDAFPLAIPVGIRAGASGFDTIVLNVMWPLFRMLKHVSEQGYLPSSLDPEQFHHLRRIGDVITSQASLQNGVIVVDGATAYRCDIQDGEIDVQTLSP